jgi:hypothetical protein
MYNVLEALRSGRILTSCERIIHETGLVTVLRSLHDELDAAVAEAYGWPVDLPDQEIVSRLVQLNAERAAEEESGIVRWLRPEYQCKTKAEREMMQNKLLLDSPPPPSKPAKPKAERRVAWPSGVVEQTQAVRKAIASLHAVGADITVEAVTKRFMRAPRERVRELLDALETLGYCSVSRDAGTT